MKQQHMTQLDEDKWYVATCSTGSVILVLLISVQFLFYSVRSYTCAIIICNGESEYVLRDVYLPNAVAFHTSLLKYLTAIVMTLN